MSDDVRKQFADAVMELIQAELKQILGEPLKENYTDCDQRMIKCLNRVGANVRRIQFGKPPLSVPPGGAK